MPCLEWGAAEVCTVRATVLRCVGQVECPSTNPGDEIVTHCVAQVQSDPVVENNEPIEPDMGCSGVDACWSIPQCDVQKYENLTARFGSWNSGLSGIMTGDTVYVGSNGDPIGVGRRKGKLCQSWALEAWGQIGKQNPNCGVAGGSAASYYVWPRIKGGSRSGVQLSKGQVAYFEVTGATADAPTCWSAGGPGGAQLGVHADFPSAAGYSVTTSVGGVTTYGDVSAGPLLWTGPIPAATCAAMV